MTFKEDKGILSEVDAPDFANNERTSVRSGSNYFSSEPFLSSIPRSTASSGSSPIVIKRKLSMGSGEEAMITIEYKNAISTGEMQWRPERTQAAIEGKIQEVQPGVIQICTTAQQPLSPSPATWIRSIASPSLALGAESKSRH